MAVLTIWPDQFLHDFTRHNAFRLVFAFHFWLGCLLFLCAHLRKATFDIPEAFLGPTQLSKMELFAKIVKAFQAITIISKTAIFDGPT